MKKLLISLLAVLLVLAGNAYPALADKAGNTDDGAVRFLRTVSQKIEGDNDTWMLAHTSKAIQKAARDAYDYDCDAKVCYGWWILRTGSQDMDDLVSIKSAGKGWYTVRRRHNDGQVDIRMRVARSGKSYKITGLINPEHGISIR